MRQIFTSPTPVQTARPPARPTGEPARPSQTPAALTPTHPDRPRMTADELRAHRAYPRLFDLDGTPVRVLSKSHLPEIYVGEGQWQPLPARSHLLVRRRYVTQKRFAALRARFDQFLDNGGPFVE
jgi:hypothetical protein